MASVAGVAGSTALSRAALPVAAATMLVLLIFQVMGLRTSELRLSRGPYALLDHAGAAPDTRAATAQLGELIRRLQNGGSRSAGCLHGTWIAGIYMIGSKRVRWTSTHGPQPRLSSTILYCYDKTSRNAMQLALEGRVGGGA